MRLSREQSELTELVEKYYEYKAVIDGIAESEEIIADKSLDADFRELAEAELADFAENKETIEEELKMLLIPKDPNDNRNTILEIRAGTGGDEAALFAGDLFRMYTKYAERKSWKVEIIDANEAGVGGYKEIVALVTGKGVYGRLKFESGVHRVQRVPVTDSGGRIHTSAATVAILPEADDAEIDIAQKDLRIDIYCASGPGGQCVNTTYSAIRITHLPTGVVVQCQDERSQIKNKAKAMKVLKSRLLEHAEDEKARERSEDRKSQVGSGDRSERIRTYNYPQNRMTDHRIGLTLHKLDMVLEGDLDDTIDALITEDNTERLKQI
jgi:peptide chain release factor 1